jgi:hypothetical protein
MEKVYIPYKLSGKVINWKEKWFYVENHAPALLSRTPGVPKWHGEWNQKPQSLFQVNDLLDKIRDLAEHLIGASVVMSWMSRRIQPLRQRSHFGFHCMGVTDPSWFSFDKISEKEVMHRVRRVFNGVLGVPVLSDAITIKDPPKEVRESSRLY